MLTVTIATTATGPSGLGAEAFGVAPSPGDGTRGTHAYILFDRVERFADEHRVSLGYVLAGAIAHGIGHLLLPPNAHAAEGIMRSNWHPSLFPPKARGRPGFHRIKVVCSAFGPGDCPDCGAHREAPQRA